MMESRACYGYYGKGHGATGESVPKKPHASGYGYWRFNFEIKGIDHYEYPFVQVKAIDYEHALKQIQRQAKRERFVVVAYQGKTIW